MQSLSHRFTINFVDKPTQHCIFHLDFRFNEGDAYHKAVVRNSNYPHGHWGEEERSENPLQRGKPFKIEIKVLGDRFNVSYIQINSIFGVSSYNYWNLIASLGRS